MVVANNDNVHCGSYTPTKILQELASPLHKQPETATIQRLPSCHQQRHAVDDRIEI